MYRSKIYLCTNDDFALIKRQKQKETKEENYKQAKKWEKMKQRHKKYKTKNQKYIYE